MKQCPNCGEVFVDEYDYCLQDGTRLVASGGRDPFLTEATLFRQKPPYRGASRKSANLMAIAAAALIFLLLGIGGTYLFLSQRNGSRDNSGLNPTGNMTPYPAKDPITPTPSPTPTPAPTPDKAQLMQLINSKIKSNLSKEELEESDKKFRKILYGDLDGDGDEDAVVHYGWSFIGGNGWGTSLMAITLENSEYSFAADTAVGAKMGRSTELVSVKNGRINLKTMSYTEDDGACCPSIEGSAVYTLKGGQLVEAKKGAE